MPSSKCKMRTGQGRYFIRKAIYKVACVDNSWLLAFTDDTLVGQPKWVIEFVDFQDWLCSSCIEFFANRRECLTKICCHGASFEILALKF